MWTRRRWEIICLCFLCLLFVGGCGRKKVSADSQVPESEEVSKTPADDGWKVTGFQVTDQVGEETALWAAEYDRWQHEGVGYDPSGESIYERLAMVRGEQIYRLCCVYPQEGEEERGRNLLEIYDVSAGQSSLIEIDSKKFDAGNGSIVSMFVTKQGEYVFRVLNEQEQINKIVYTDLGNRTQIVDAQPAYQEKGIAGQLCYECICDEAGNIYTRDSKCRDLYILDRAGGLLMEYKGKRGDSIRQPFSMPSGELIFPVYNSEEKVCRLVWFDTEQKKDHLISSFESYPIESVYGVQGSDIYYEAWEGIVKWNISSGERTLVYPFDQYCISRLYRTMLVLREEGSPVLRMYGTVNEEEEDWLVSLSEEEVKPEAAIRVVSLIDTSFDVKSCAAAASRKYVDHTYVYETFEKSGQEDYRNRILAEMAAGDGPDILFVSRQDMKLLQDQGYLLDLKSVLSKEYLNRILPGVLEMGTVNETLAGLAPLMRTNTAVTLKSIWNQDTWTLEDVFGLMDSGEFSTLFCQGFAGAFCQMNMSYDAEIVIGILTEIGLDDFILIDWETGESKFNSELFMRMLYMAKNYSGAAPGQEPQLGAGGCLMKRGGLNIKDFNELYDQYGEAYCLVGLPSNAGNSNYLSCEGVMVISRTATNMEAIAAFFECLLRDEFQNVGLLNGSVLKISSEDIEYREEGDERKAYWKDQELRIKEDGTTTFDDYAAFLESCVPYPLIEGEDFIKSIVLEEAEAYINGDKSAEEVAGIIHSRVQLYLDENR